MKILADACVAASLVQALRTDGHDVVFAGEGPPLVPDEAILEQAQLEGRLLLTEDHDFGALVIRDGRPVAGIVLVELHGLSAKTKSARMIQIFRSEAPDLLGAFTVVEPGRVRRRVLLLGS